MRLKKFIAVLLLLFIFISSSYASDIYNSDPTFSPYYAGSVNSTVLYDALAELNYIRWLVGVSNNVTLSAEYTNKAQHGAVLLDAIDTLTHTPSKPADMSEEFYALGYESTSHGNIAVAKIITDGVARGNMTLSYSTKLYMHDSDTNNISRVGHRRWLMNPRLKQTGFGISTRRGYAVTYVIEEDVSMSWPISDEFITWPVNKHEHPLTYFETETAWSVALNRDVFDECDISAVKVFLTRLRDGEVWEFSNNYSDGYFNISGNTYAYDECIIFRPENLSGYSDGEQWRVEISGLTRKDGGTGNISYNVIFTSEKTGYEDDSHSVSNYTINYGNNNSGSGGCNAGFGIITLLIIGIPHVKTKRVGK